MSTPTTFLHNTALSVGPLVIGTTFNAFVYGICVVQFSNYWEHKMNDSIVIKVLVTWTLCLDTIHTFALLYMLWVYVVVNFNNPEFVMTALWPFSSTPIVTALTSFPIQIYLSWRIRQFSKSNVVFAVFYVLSLAQATLGIICSVRAYTNSDLATYSRLIPFVAVWQVAAVVTDLGLTVFLSIYLIRSRTGQRRSDNVISRVISLAIETAAVGAFFCIMDLITFTALLNTNVHVIFAFPMGRIYTGTLLLTLNSRPSLRAELEKSIAIPEIALDQPSQNASTMEPISNRMQDAIDISRGPSNTTPCQEKIDIDQNTDQV